MLCPSCGHDKSEVLNSRKVAPIVRRRRRCLKCGQKFTTHERIFRPYRPALPTGV